MIRRLMASSAMLALVTAGTISLAQAQTEPMQTPPAVQDQQTPPTDSGATTEAAPAAGESTGAEPAKGTEQTAQGSESTLTPDEPTLATAFVGKSVYSSQDPEADNIGNVNDLIISQDGTITHAVVGVGGFLGIGEKNVAVPFDELEVSEGDGELRLIYAATREELEAAQEFDRTAYDPEARSQPQDTASTGGGSTGMGSTGGAGMAGGMGAAGGGMASSEPMTSSGTDTANTDAAATSDTAANESMATDQDQMASDTSGTAGAGGTTEMAQTDPAASSTAPTDTGGAEAAFVDFNADQLRASNLMGRELFGEGDESIGEVSDLVLQPDGETRAALVDVGGFLGVGEKQVAIPFDQIQVTEGQTGEEPRITTAMTREQLEQAPEWQDPAEQQTADAPATGQDAASTDQMAAGDQAATGGQDLADAQEVSAENIIGTAVYGQGDESIGEVGDLVLTSQGSIEAVVIDVGGFLGVGEKSVAIQYDSLNVQKDNNGETRIMVNATQEQLENAPAYDEETGTAAPAQ